MSEQCDFKCSYLVNTSPNRTQHKTMCKKSFWKQLKIKQLKLMMHIRQKKKSDDRGSVISLVSVFP